MALEYTKNLHLGIQRDKSDYFDFGAITDNWEKIDAAYAGGTGGTKPEVITLLTDAGPQPIGPFTAEYTPID